MARVCVRTADVCSCSMARRALRQAVGRVFGSSNPVQRCRNHKVRNVLSHLPQEQHEQARSTPRAAWTSALTCYNSTKEER